MKSEQAINLGKKLAKARVEKKITLESIADKTKINVNFLKQMEQGNFEFLPELYVKNFLKTFIRNIGENDRQYLFEYNQIVSENNNSNDEVKETKAQKKKAENLLFSKLKSLFASLLFY